MVENWTQALQSSKRPETERCWSDVPPQLLSLILSRLFLRDRCNFKSVCKSWNLVVPVPRPLPPPVHSPHFNSPCLMFSQTSSSSWKLFHSLYNDFYNVDFPELVDAKICFAKDGWLLMSQNEDECAWFVFNPFTKVKFELPPTTSSFISVCFTSPPTSSDCFVFGLFVCDSKFGLIKLGDNEWKTGWISNYEYDFWQTDCPPLFHNGIFYWLGYKSRNIRIFDSTKEDDESRWINFGEEEEGEEAEEVIDNSYMLEVEGDIWVVFVRNEGKKISVEKLDLSEMRWNKLETWGDKCLYISTFGSFAETCFNSELANTIYFDKFYDKSGVIYSLSSRMYYSLDGNFATKKVCDLSRVQLGAWIKPTLLL